ncbi:unnamed protein product [Durusdinium trenchii]|uniref:PAS domain-containing protein n=1 Tax=Durusdinium trenchii TaxID=1381693 RepID=A0ABP0K6J5_9DINO
MCVMSQRCDLASQMLAKEESAAFLMAPDDLSLVAVSAELCRQMRRSDSEMLGKHIQSFQEGVPGHSVSRSSNSKIRAFREATELNPHRNGEIAAVQVCQRGDGSQFVAYQFFYSGKVEGRSLVLCVQLELCEGHRPDMKMLPEIQEEAREQLWKALALLGGRPQTIIDKDVGFGFFQERLQEQCLLLDARSCQRREFNVLPRGAQVFSDRPLKPEPGGLRFAVRVDAASRAFAGLPFMGFTRQVPNDCPSLYADIATNTAQSLLVGGCGEASARDQPTHFKSGFKAPPQSEVQTFSHQPDLLRHQRTAPQEPEIGDILECRYTWQGQIQMLINDQMILEFNTGRPLTDEAHYAVLDVAFAAHRLTLVSPRQSFLSDTCVASASPDSTCCNSELDRDPSFSSFADLSQPSITLSEVPRSERRRDKLLE